MTRSICLCNYFCYNLFVELKSEQRRAWIAFFVSHGVLTRKVEAALAAKGHPSLEVYEVLLNLEVAERGMLRMSELADRVIYSRSGLTRLVDRLERQGWLRREACPSDRRAIHAVITESGLALREAAWPVYRDAVQEHFGAHMSADEAHLLGDVLGRFVEDKAIP